MSDPIYAFRRKGQFDFCTCSEYRYHECADMPELFEVAIFFTEQQLAAKDAEIARLQSAYDFATVLVAKLHVAAMGEVVGPVLGVVEDVANVREQMLEAQEQLAYTRTQWQAMHNEWQKLNQQLIEAQGQLATLRELREFDSKKFAAIDKEVGK